MIQIQMEFDLGGLKKALKELELKVADLNRPMQAALDELRQIQIERFESFGSIPNDPLYKKKKGGKPTGVKTGELKRAFYGGKGRISKASATIARGMELVWGLDMSKFRDEHPKYFDAWLQANSDQELIDLKEEHFDRIAARFKAELDAIIEGATR